MTNFKIFLRDGKPMIGEFPEEPQWHEMPVSPMGCDYEIRDEQRDDYNAAVEAAKASAVEVIEGIRLRKDWRGCYSFAVGTPNNHPLNLEWHNENEFVELPKGCTVEYGWQYFTSKRYYGAEADWTDCTEDQFNSVASIPDSITRKIARLIPSKASGIVATVIAEPQPGKGDKGGECNRASCQQKGAMFYNHSTRKYYCTGCASLINEHNHADAMEIYGHALCTLDSYVSPVIPEGSEKEFTEENWRQRFTTKKDLTIADVRRMAQESIKVRENEGRTADFEDGFMEGFISAYKPDKPAIDDTLKESDATYKEQQIEILAEIESVIKSSHNAAIDKALTAMKIEWREDRHEIYNAIEKLKL